MAVTITGTNISDGTNSTSATNIIQGSSKSWGNFNGITTVSIRASYNISSIGRPSAGNYTPNFTNALPSANYSITTAMGANSASTDGTMQIYSLSTTSCQIQEKTYGSNPFDVYWATFAAFN